MLPEDPHLQEECLSEDHSCHIKPLLDLSAQDQISQDALLPSFCLFPAPSYDFRFCANRRQTVEGHIRYETQPDIITISNGADGLNISAPFPPGPQQSWALPTLLGTYRFCIYWFQDDHLFNLTYGISSTYQLSYQANYPFSSRNVICKPSEDGPDSLSNVSYTFNNGSLSHSFPSVTGCKFFLDFGKRDQKKTSSVEEEIGEAELKLKSLETRPSSDTDGPSEDPFLFLQQLESKLNELEFPGDHQTFEGRVMHANIQKVPLQIPESLPIGVTLKENNVVRKFQVNLPKKVFEKTRDGFKSEEMKVVVLSATSETLFQRNLTPICVFWDVSSKGKYLKELGCKSEVLKGCEVVPEEYQTTCLCDHLTFFAVLMVASPDIDHIHYEYLTIVTYVGCIISALASKKQRDHIVYVHMNLLWAIFLLDMSFLIAVPLAPTGGDTACKAGAMFLHFSVLACLTWMAIEGYSLYRLVIEVFNSYVKHLLFKLCLVGWGLPMFIVCLIFAIDQSHYGPSSFKVYEAADKYTNSTICWITKQEIHNFLNLGYLSLVLFFNSIMLATMVYEILRLRHREHHWEYVVMLLGLSCVLGIPWGLVFFAFASGTFKLVAVYLFTIINSLQGFLIFLWYLAKVLQSRRSSSMQCTTSNSLKLQSTSSSI
ncbi:hypothetical protein Chor_013227 [Crotalus horridus]